ncbi:MAG: YqgE/AlgH family protein, partial [Pirellulaceae bacterium]
QGHFLVASPHLPDSNFFRSVVLMVQHDEHGALGLVLNRLTNSTVRELWASVASETVTCERYVNHGGPVEGPLMALHTTAACADDEVLPGVYFASRDEYLERIVQDEDRPFRLFVGYAGWSSGQLESELEAGGWLTIKATQDDVFNENKDLWREISSRIGLEILKQAVNPKHVPDDPSVN